MENSSHTLSFNQFFEKYLNSEQQKAVEPKNGVLLVCAGAGSGKTRVITSRIAHLILNHEVEASSILALTFTNKAANEMKERVANFLPEERSLPFVGTFHSFCLRLLKTNSQLLPHASFSLMDEDDQLKLIRSIINKNGLNKKVAPKQIISFISKIKNEALTQQEKEELWQYDNLLKEIYHLYEHEKNNAHCLDFDDLLVNTLNLFKNKPEFKASFQKRVRHVLVDEYQDTNKIQHALLTQMVNNDESKFLIDSLCVVGDEDQSIYSWRGATVSNIINFKKDFENTTSIVIDQNYRSVQPILNTANELIKNNVYRNPKKLWSTREASDRIRLISCSSSYQEAEAIAIFLKKSKKSGLGKNSLNSNAILYRSHFQSRSIEEALIRNSIPYKIIGGIQFYERLEIKDLFAYLRLIVNPFDRFAFSRVINTPTRGLGEKFEDLFLSYWVKQPLLDFKEISKLLLESKQLTKIKEEALKDFINIFDGLAPHNMTSEVLNIILFKTNYFNYLKESFEKEEADTKKDNIKELISSINYFEEKNSYALDLFLQEVSLMQEMLSKNTSNDDFIRLMTLHAAKGLEFDTIILPGIEEGIIPSSHSLYNPENLEEERRLLYVGITRARENLFLTYSKNRYTYGQLTEQRPSRFIDELPEEYIQREDCSYWNTEQFEKYFYAWGAAPQGITPEQNVTQKHTAIKQKTKPSGRDPVDTIIDQNSEHNWTVNQLINHETFGFGTIQKIEKKSSITYITARFKNGLKKVHSKFIKIAEL